MKLSTTLGEVSVFIDNIEIEYRYEGVAQDQTCENVDGRYRIKVIFVPDGRQHRISCRINRYIPSEEDGIESGQDLMLKNFHNGNAKLSMGMVEGLAGYNSAESRNQDYSNEYLDDGIEYVILDTTKTESYVFGISWIKNCTEENSLQTWFGADPTLMNAFDVHD